METKIVQLDGANAGIAVEVIANKRRFVRYKDNIRIFKNLELAKVTCNRLTGECGNRAEYYIVTKDLRIPISKCYITKHSFEYLDITNNIRYIFRNEVNLTATQLGYLVFEDGDIIRCDKKYGYKRQRDLFNYVLDMASEMVSENFLVTKVERKNMNHIILRIRNSTGAIHIISNARLMDINQARKANGERCIPYIKQMDKFTTLFFYCVKDSFEPTRINSIEIMDEAIVDLSVRLQNNIPETSPKIVDVEFSGYINIEEDY